jgi:hypothetical protein
VEVRAAECGLERRILQPLLAVDQLCLHRGVEVVLVEPVGDAFGKWVVIERVAEVGDGALDFARGGRGGYKRARSVRV